MHAQATRRAKVQKSVGPVGVQLSDVHSLTTADQDSKDEREHTLSKIESELARPAFQGTFTEYSPKVIQFGFVALFSVAYPLSAFAAGITNFAELRVDALKLSYSLRRPRYLGAQSIKRVGRGYIWVSPGKGARAQFSLCHGSFKMSVFKMSSK